MSSLPSRLGSWVEVAESAADRTARIEVLISIADRFREVPAEVAQRPFPADHRVPACESEAYVWATPRPDGTLDFHFAVENPQGLSARAMAAVLSDGLSGAPLDQILEVPDDVPSRLFGRELSMGKNMGLVAMLSMVRALAKRELGRATP